jgi:hypothetical protein
VLFLSLVYPVLRCVQIQYNRNYVLHQTALRCCIALQAGGLSPALVHRMLRPSNPSPLLIDALTIISQLARVQPTGGSCNMYEPLLKSNLLPLIRQLMEQQDAGGFGQRGDADCMMHSRGGQWGCVRAGPCVCEAAPRVDGLV